VGMTIFADDNFKGHLLAYQKATQLVPMEPRAFAEDIPQLRTADESKVVCGIKAHNSSSESPQSDACYITCCSWCLGVAIEWGSPGTLNLRCVLESCCLGHILFGKLATLSLSVHLVY